MGNPSNPCAAAIFVMVPLTLCAQFCMGDPGFSEQAVQRGISYTTNQSSLIYGAGLVFADLDDDGDPDIVTVGRNDSKVGLFENLGNGNFAATTIPGLTISAAGGITAADYDGDRDLDLYFSNVGIPNRLLRNDGNLTFTDVTAVAGVGDAGAGHGCTWGDFDRDGWIDLYVANRTTFLQTQPNRLYRNNGDGTFSDVAGVLGVDRGGDPTFQASFFDFNRDGWPDLYLCTDKGENNCNPYRNHLFKNVGGAFVDVTDSSGTQACIGCMGTAIADINRDSMPDVYCSNVPDGNVLFLNSENETFAESATSAGVGSYAMGWGVEFFDYDNDGFQELYVCNSSAMNRLFDWAGVMPFVDIAPTMGAAMNEPSYCVATADLENDGDLDVLVQSSFANVRLFVNNFANGGNWVRFRLYGDGPNMRGVGARVIVETPGSRQEQEVRAGSGFKSCSSYDPHFGVGAETSITRVIVHWPDGTTSIVENPPLNAVVSIDQATTLVPPPCALTGDMNNDAVINGDDIQSFVGVMMGRTAACSGDWNTDGVIDTVDIGILVTCLLSSSCP